MTAPRAVLVIEDEPGLREGLAGAVESLGLRAVPASGIVEARRFLHTEAIDCILLDIRLKDGDGLEFLGELRQGNLHDVPVIIATAYGDGERTIRAMRDGAFDYLTKPFDLPTLLATVERAVKQRALTRSLDPIAGTPTRAADVGADAALVGTSAAMLSIWKLIGRAAASNAPVLITGETGTGKELVARAIHRYSSRNALPFVAVNLAALPVTLLETELFGHERGAFTGATGRKSGRFELAGEGTLFLDEIGDLDLALQTKLLRVLQEGTFERVGGAETLPARARVVTATNKRVRPGEVAASLREDLYYRLAVVEIEVPPLRSRRSDIPLLVAHALRRTPARAVSEEAMARLLAYDWPGNVRELFHVLERAAVLCGGEVLDVGDFPETVRAGGGSSEGQTTAPFASGPGGATSGGGSKPPADEGVTLREAIAKLERRMIVAALERARGNRSEAARQLGIGRPQLYAKLDEYGLAGKPEA